VGNVRYPVCGRHRRRPTLDWSSPGRKTEMRYPTRASERVHRRLRPRLRPCPPTSTQAASRCGPNACVETTRNDHQTGQRRSPRQTACRRQMPARESAMTACRAQHGHLRHVVVTALRRRDAAGGSVTRSGIGHDGAKAPGRHPSPFSRNLFFAVRAVFGAPRLKPAVSDATAPIWHSCASRIPVSHLPVGSQCNALADRNCP
jgi:hypothetical protein